MLNDKEKDILAKAREVIKEREDESNYIAICINARICPKCGCEGINRLYTGMVRSKPYGWECNTCGYDPREDDAIVEIEDPYHQLRVARGVMHGDHIHLKSKGGKDTAENINTLCCRCHMIKTYKEQDYLGNKG